MDPISIVNRFQVVGDAQVAMECQAAKSVQLSLDEVASRDPNGVLPQKVHQKVHQRVSLTIGSHVMPKFSPRMLQCITLGL